MSLWKISDVFLTNVTDGHVAFKRFWRSACSFASTMLLPMNHILTLYIHVTEENLFYIVLNILFIHK